MVIIISDVVYRAHSGSTAYAKGAVTYSTTVSWNYLSILYNEWSQWSTTLKHDQSNKTQLTTNNYILIEAGITIKCIFTKRTTKHNYATVYGKQQAFCLLLGGDSKDFPAGDDGCLVVVVVVFRVELGWGLCVWWVVCRNVHICHSQDKSSKLTPAPRSLKTQNHRRHY